jgi:hypothetical protein
MLHPNDPTGAPREPRADAPSHAEELLHTMHLLDAARAHLNASLREEGEALAREGEAVNTSGAASEQAVRAMRRVQIAHAGLTAAAAEVCALHARADRANAAAEAPAGPVCAATFC